MFLQFLCLIWTERHGSERFNELLMTATVLSGCFWTKACQIDCANIAPVGQSKQILVLSHARSKLSTSEITVRFLITRRREGKVGTKNCIYCVHMYYTVNYTREDVSTCVANAWITV